MDLPRERMISKNYIYFNSLKKGYGDRKLILCDTRDIDTRDFQQSVTKYLLN